MGACVWGEVRRGAGDGGGYLSLSLGLSLSLRAVFYQNISRGGWRLGRRSPSSPEAPPACGEMLGSLTRLFRKGDDNAVDEKTQVWSHLLFSSINITGVV